MSQLILPRRFYSQPQGVVNIDWSNPLTDGLIVAFSAGSGFRNLAASTELVKVGSPNLLAVTQDGVSANFALATNDGLSVGSSSVYNPPEQTLFVIANTTSFGGNQGMILFSRDSDTLGRSFALDIYNYDSFGVRYYVNGGGTLNTNELRENVAPTAKRYAACATQIGSNAVLYLDGKLVASSSGFQSIASSTGDTQIGRRTYVGYTQSLNGTLPFAAMWKRALSPNEVVAVNNNPWQLFRAKPRVLYFDVGGATDTPSAASSGSFSITGSAANGTEAKLSAANSSSYTLTGSDAAGLVAKVSAAGSSSYTITSVAASGVKESAGDTPSAASSGSFTISGVAASGVRALKTNAETSSYTITGSDASGLISIGANAEAGSFSISGSDAQGQWIHVSDASSDAFIITGIDAIGVKSGAISLTQADLDAIAAAVWADATAVAAHAKLDAIIARLTC